MPPPSLPQTTLNREIYSVSHLSSAVRTVIETNFPSVWVEGELSNFVKPSSGHLYFTLKDGSAQVRCAMFRGKNRLLKFRPADGLQVLLRANVSLYEARGDFQLIVEQMEEAGDGLLQQKFEALKAQLAQEGLFDASAKQDIPLFPQRIGIITSPTGAAIRDILSVLKRRYPSAPILIYPVAVQGEEAPGAITHALQKANSRQECDVLILARGGGSLEDLWAFNDEGVARAIYNCQIPIVAGVGHEIDISIADFAADLRAPTPSAAAELVSPNRDEWLEVLSNFRKRLTLHTKHQLSHSKQRVTWLSRQLQHPKQRINTQTQRLDELEQRLLKSERILRQNAHARLNTLSAKLQQHSPRQRLREYQLQYSALSQRCKQAIQQRILASKTRLTNLSRALEAVSPLATLGRGYAIVKTSSDHTIVRQAKQLKPGQALEIQLQHGHVITTVNKIAPDE
ncbi:MAG: exodeoxyribonuclease VII large subunit [Gammaproteobacteria bacterium]|nr:exodeoxyribonuclease VII large subunit [Gammaproteobacteria bacterium]